MTQTELQEFQKKVIILERYDPNKYLILGETLIEAIQLLYGFGFLNYYETQRLMSEFPNHAYVIKQAQRAEA